MADEPQAFFYQATGDHISETFERLLIPMQTRLPTYELREWHKNLQRLAGLGDGAAEFSARLNEALRNHNRRATHPWYRAIVLITLIQTTIAANQPLDPQLVSLFVGSAGTEDVRRTVANLLDELYAGEAERSTAGPAAFYRVARSALLISDLETKVSPGLARYLTWLGVAERAIASGPGNETARLELAAALKEMEAALVGRYAALEAMGKDMEELTAEIARVSRGDDRQGLQGLQTRYEELTTSFAQVQSQSVNELGSQRIVQFLRTRMRETLQWLNNNKEAVPGTGILPTSPWGWLRLHFGGLPDRMVSWGWVNLTLMTLAALLLLRFIFRT